MSSSSSNSQPNNQQQPSLLSGHVEYMKGAAESTIGKVMGSHAWTLSGEQDKAHAVSVMGAAAEGRDSAKSGYGKAEETLGRLTGCEGMKQEGAASSKKS